jgi:hypothetical protein
MHILESFAQALHNSRAREISTLLAHLGELEKHWYFIIDTSWRACKCESRISFFFEIMKAEFQHNTKVRAFLESLS